MVKVKEGANALNKKGFTALELSEHSPTNFKSFSIVKILMAAGLTRGNEQNNLPPPLEIVGATVGGNEQNNFPRPPSATVGPIVGGSEQNNLPPPSATVVDVHESANPSRASKKMSKWLEYLRYQGNWIQEMPGALMVVATVISTITFQPAISPPGGVWQTDVDSGVKWGSNQNITCEARTSVLACKPDYSYQYFTFMICNTVSFTASLCVTFLLISGFPLGNKVCMGLLTFAMCTTLAFLAFAYLVAFNMLLPNETLYLVFDVNPFNIRYWVEFSLMAVIGVVLLIHTIRFLVWVAMKIRKFTLYMQRR